MKKGDDVTDDEDDDAVRISVSQDQVTATLCTEELFLRAQSGQSWGGTVNTVHEAFPSGFHTSQLDLHTIYRISDKCDFSYNYFVTGEDNKADFSIPSDTLPQIIKK
jgi:hypothetical protein